MVRCWFITLTDDARDTMLILDQKRCENANGQFFVHKTILVSNLDFPHFFYGGSSRFQWLFPCHRRIGGTVPSFYRG